MDEIKVWYYGVVYFDNGEASVSAPFDSKEKMLEAMKAGIATHPHRVVATSYMTRKGRKMVPTVGLFGCPNSRNLMKNRKFVASL